jgi:hypothetical protein
MNNPNGQTDLVASTPRTFVPPTAETAATSAAAQAEAIVKARYTMAIARPRDIDTVRENILKACKRPRFAASAIYLKPVGKGVEGPSIRFAEEAARAMGNIDANSAVVFDDDSKRIVRVWATDLEANQTYSRDVCIEKTVERRHVRDGQEVIKTRTNSYDKKVYIVRATEDDLLNKQAALESKYLRGCLLRLVPADIVEEALDRCREVTARTDAEDPDAARKRVFDAFAAVGVTAKQLKDYLGVDAASLQPAALNELRAMFATIRDGEATWQDYLDKKAVEEEGTVEGEPREAKAAKSRVEQIKERGRQAKESAPAPGEPNEPTPTADPDDDEKAQILADERAEEERRVAEASAIVGNTDSAKPSGKASKRRQVP